MHEALPASAAYIIVIPHVNTARCRSDDALGATAAENEATMHHIKASWTASTGRILNTLVISSVL
jgi:hypothetical protein